MNTILAISFFVLGIIIGSFLNVVIYRYNTGRGIGGRSNCFSCRRILTWIDLFPILSYVFLGGKCRTCKSKISWQYPVVELITGLLFLGVFFVDMTFLLSAPTRFLYESIFHMVVMSILVVIIVYDLKHKIIPDAFAYVFATISIFHMFIGVTDVGGFVWLSPDGWAMLAGPILAFPFYILWLVSDGRWMGLGDAKLALGIGWFLGLSAGGSAIIFGFWVGAAISVGLLLLARFFHSMRTSSVKGIGGKNIFLPRLTMKSEIPFAPFLIIGLLIAFFLKYNVFSSLTFF